MGSSHLLLTKCQRITQFSPNSGFLTRPAVGILPRPSRKCKCRTVHAHRYVSTKTASPPSLLLLTKLPEAMAGQCPCLSSPSLHLTFQGASPGHCGHSPTRRTGRWCPAEVQCLLGPRCSKQGRGFHRLHLGPGSASCHRLEVFGTIKVRTPPLEEEENWD